jgi:hypothetical protein
MGAILKGRDTDIGRDLAVKVLLEQHVDKPDLIRRFVVVRPTRAGPRRSCSARRRWAT